MTETATQTGIPMPRIPLWIPWVFVTVLVVVGIIFIVVPLVSLAANGFDVKQDNFKLMTFLEGVGAASLGVGNVLATVTVYAQAKYG